jgi:hypothetical protein
MPRVGSQPMIPVFEGQKIVHTLVRPAAVIGQFSIYCSQIHHIYFHSNISYHIRLTQSGQVTVRHTVEQGAAKFGGGGIQFEMGIMQKSHDNTLLN